MPVGGLVFNVTRIDRNFPGLFLGSTINIFVRHGLGPPLLREDFGDRLGERGFAMVDVAYGADVHVGFVAREFVGGEVARGEGRRGAVAVLDGAEEAS